MSPKFQFSNVVVVDGDNIGCIVKTWKNNEEGYSYEVYVRYHNCIVTYKESEIQHFVYSKELTEDEREFYE